MDILQILKESNYKPEEQKDGNEFAPLSGAYNATIDRIERITGDKNGVPYDFYSLSMQIYETVDGDKGDNRYLKQTYNVDDKGMKKFMDDMFSSKINVLDFNSLSSLDASLPSAVGKAVHVRAWVRTKQIKEGDKWVDSPTGEKKQYLKIVSEFKIKKKDTTGKVPF